MVGTGAAVGRQRRRLGTRLKPRDRHRSQYCHVSNEVPFGLPTEFMLRTATPTMSLHRYLRLVFVPLLTAIAAAVPALAHPHMWVTYAMTVDYANGTVTGIEHTWSFDDTYAAMALEGLDKNNDGKYDDAELADLLKVNMEGLKDFNYFTVAKLGETDLTFNAPIDAKLDYTDKVLHLRFRLKLTKPVLADAEGLTFAIFDPSFFIDFEPEKTDAVNVASAPAGCSAALVDLDANKNDEEAKKLGAAMAQTLGNGNLGFGSYKTVAVSCKKS